MKLPKEKLGMSIFANFGFLPLPVGVNDEV